MELTRFRISFDVLILVFFTYILYESLQFRSLAGYFPGTVAGLALVLGFVNLAVDLVRMRRAGGLVSLDEESSASIRETDDPAQRRRQALRMVRYVGWVVGFVVLIWFLGMVVAVPVYLVAYFALDARTGWRFAIIAAVVATVGLIMATDVMGLRWPESVVELL